MNPIPLSDIIPLPSQTDYKLHLACADGNGNNPLLAFLEDSTAWRGWQEHRGFKNEWNRDFIFTLIDFPSKANTWLFGGIFRIVKRHSDRYEVERMDIYQAFEGRLLVNLVRPARGRAFRLESWWEAITVEQILSNRYGGDAFPGLQNINHSFKSLTPIFCREKADWKAALLNAKGIYLLTDVLTGKHYVGAAYGDTGIWSRWATYLATGHGGNKHLRELLGDDARNTTTDYALQNFKLSILEPMTALADTETVRERENHWKRVLLSRGFGMNIN